MERPSDPVVNENFSFTATEKQILELWKEKDIFKKSLNKTKNGRAYIFYDGPPFATGLPHHGHLLASTLKDIVPRYFTMKGRYVERRFGWDCHGLPIEHEIDKKLGMSAQDAVKQLGVKGYNDECRSIVGRYVSEWERTVTRMGRWVDFKNDYKTMDTTFMESVWWVFKQLWEKKLIYRGVRVVPFSTALGTVLSNFEAGQNYQDVQDPAITIMFKAKDEDAYFAAWTTTPWTLPSNLCLCVNAEIDYVLVRDEKNSLNFYMAKDRLPEYAKQKRELTVIRELKGKDLKGKRYEPLFPYFSHFQKDGGFQILNDNYVTTDAGTGIVHIAPGFGEDDFRVMKEANLHEVFCCPVDDAGKFSPEVTDYAGGYVKDLDKEIIKRLKDENKLYDQSTIVHSYPFCWRSDTPLIYKAIPSWYVAVESIKPDLIASNKEINWVPEHIKEGRFGKWLEGARDWSISRNRIWGTPLPIWENDKTGEFICVGSIEDLKKLTGITVTDLHKESVDHLDFTVEGKEGTFKRVTEVLDCWFESGAMPYAQLHYPFENEQIFKEGFPAEFIAEGLDQTRGWFYTLTVLSTALYKKPAFKNVIVNGIVMAEDGKKMSKRLKNYTDPETLMESYGADALRLYLINSGLVRAEEQRFSDAGVKDMVRRALLPWYNSFKFFQTYAKVDGFNFDKNFESMCNHYKLDFFNDETMTTWEKLLEQMFLDKNINPLDRWLLSKLNTLTHKVETEMDQYHLYNVVPALFDFIEDLTNWYIRLNRRRFWEEKNSLSKEQAYFCLNNALKQLSILLAPFTPFLSEYTYQELKKLGNSAHESVHLEDYPKILKIKDENLEDAVIRMQQLILLGRQKRTQVNIKVKTPLRSLTVIHKDEKILGEIKKLENYIQTELNIKDIHYSTKEHEFINFTAKPNLPVLGKRLGKELGKFSKLIQSLSSEQLITLEEKGSLLLDGQTFHSTDILISREPRAGTEALSNRYVTIDLDCKLDPSLISEGLAREVINRIQRTRKEIGLAVEERIHLTVDGDSELIDAVKAHADHIQKETLATKLTFQKLTTADIEVNELTLRLKIEKQ